MERHVEGGSRLGRSARWVVLAMVLLLGLVASSPSGAVGAQQSPAGGAEAAAGGHREVILEITEGRVRLVSDRLRPTPLPPVVPPAAGPTLEVAALDDQGAVVRTETISDARVVIVDHLTDDGTLTGGPVGLATAQVVVRLPAGIGAARLSVSGPDINPSASTVDLVGAARSAPASWPSTTIVSGGDPSRAVDVVLLGDGYPPDELSRFVFHARDAANHLITQHPFDALKGRINVHRVDVPSAESGTDDRCAGVVVDTAFDTGYESTGADCRLLISSNLAAIYDAAASAPAADVVVVLVNSYTYGGSAYYGGPGFSYAGIWRDEVVAHEFGHAFGWLGDEYDYASGSYVGDEPFQANLTASPSGARAKWGRWIDPATPLPTTDTADDQPGAYEGAGTYSSGLYRPTYDSKMRSLDRPYERVNAELLARQVMAYGPADPSPPSASLTVTSGATSATGRVTLGITGSDQESGVVGYQVSSSNAFADGAMQPAGLGPSVQRSTDWDVGSAPGPHTIWLRVRNGAGMESVTSAQVTVTGSPPALSVGDASVVEGNSGTRTASFRVLLSRPAPAPVTLRYATEDGTARAGSEYVARPPTTLTIGRGQSAKTVTVTVRSDTVVEPTERFFVRLSAATGATIADGRAEGTITNDDLPRLSISDATVVEGNAGTRTASFRVQLTDPAPVPVTVRYATEDGTARAGSDYVARPPTTVTLGAGQRAKTVTVTVRSDTVVEPTERFFVRLSHATGATIADERGVGTITNDD